MSAVTKRIDAALSKIAAIGLNPEEYRARIDVALRVVDAAMDRLTAGETIDRDWVCAAVARTAAPTMDGTDMLWVVDAVLDAFDRAVELEQS